MRSMTGFGQAIRATEEMDVAVEIKTGNSRYLDLKLRLPKELTSLEPELRKEIQSRLHRGRVDVYLDLNLKSGSQYEVNKAVVQNYLQTAEKVGSLGAEGKLDVSTIFQLPGVVVPRPMDLSAQGLLQTIQEVFGEALEEVVSTRSSEGEALKEDFSNRIQNLERVIHGIAQEAEQVPDYHRKRLTQRIEQLKQEGVVDENRLTQEILYYADRCDIAEEITRLRSHITHFQQDLNGSESEVIGRRLDFIAQEMGREMNTILSKSPLAGLSELALEGKTEIEKIREQVQNVE
ncbi:YicC family protein [Acidobacteria bacterium AH-259-D05]|nr:YicC family protein [Acidobacteria bacterium AH-259-D05]